MRDWSYDKKKVELNLQVKNPSNPKKPLRLRMKVLDNDGEAICREMQQHAQKLKIAGDGMKTPS